MARSRMIHGCSSLNFVLIFVDKVALVGEDRADVILFLLSTNEEYLILSLDGSKFLGENLSISNQDIDSGLGFEMVDEQLLLLLCIVMESWLD